MSERLSFISVRLPFCWAANSFTLTEIGHESDLTRSCLFCWPLRLALVVPWIVLGFITTDGTLISVHHQYAVPFCVFFLFAQNWRSVMRYFVYNFLLQSLHYKTWPIQNRFVMSFISILLYLVYTKSWNITQSELAAVSVPRRPMV